MAMTRRHVRSALVLSSLVPRHPEAKLVDQVDALTLDDRAGAATAGRRPNARGGT